MKRSSNHLNAMLHLNGQKALPPVRQTVSKRAHERDEAGR